MWCLWIRLSIGDEDGDGDSNGDGDGDGDGNGDGLHYVCGAFGYVCRLVMVMEIVMEMEMGPYDRVRRTL